MHQQPLGTLPLQVCCPQTAPLQQMICSDQIDQLAVMTRGFPAATAQHPKTSRRRANAAVPQVTVVAVDHHERVVDCGSRELQLLCQPLSKVLKLRRAAFRVENDWRRCLISPAIDADVRSDWSKVNPPEQHRHLVKYDVGEHGGGLEVGRSRRDIEHLNEAICSLHGMSEWKRIRRKVAEPNDRTVIEDRTARHCVALAVGFPAQADANSCCRRVSGILFEKLDLPAKSVGKDKRIVGAQGRVRRDDAAHSRSALVQISLVEVQQSDIEFRAVTCDCHQVHLARDAIAGIEDQNPSAEPDPSEIPNRAIEHRWTVSCRDDEREELQWAHCAAV